MGVQNRQQPSQGDGATATYASGSGRSALTFSCTVAARQNTAGLSATAVNLNVSLGRAPPCVDAAGSWKSRSVREQEAGATNHYW